MEREQRPAEIERRVRDALEPSSVTVVDDSHEHGGHAGARDGRGHFRVEVVSAAFEGKALLVRHRMVSAALGELMQTDIHALAISARAPSEPL